MYQALHRYVYQGQAMAGNLVKKQRAVKATDSEWDIVRARARAARLTRIESAVQTLCEVERIRLAERAEEDG